MRATDYWDVLCVGAIVTILSISTIQAQKRLKASLGACYGGRALLLLLRVW